MPTPRQIWRISFHIRNDIFFCPHRCATVLAKVQVRRLQPLMTAGADATELLLAGSSTFKKRIDPAAMTKFFTLHRSFLGWVGGDR